MENMMKVLSPTDTYDFFQQAAVAEAITEYTETFYNFVNSLKGMNGILQNVAFLMDPKNKEIADGFGQLTEGIAKYSFNAQGLADYFLVGYKNISPLMLKIVQASADTNKN
jgi:hypothetical protein